MKLSEDHCERAFGSDRQRNMIITLTSETLDSADTFKRSRPTPARSKSKLRSRNKSIGVENLMTLKQACSSEYQGAQGAFKDSMIH
jgi:hypothetical protein